MGTFSVAALWGTERKSDALVLVCRELRVLSPTCGFPTNKVQYKKKNGNGHLGEAHTHQSRVGWGL